MSITKFIKKNFLTGLLVLIPLVAVGYLGQALARWLWKLPGLLPSPAEASLGADLLIFVLSILIIGGAVAALGWISNMYLGQQILRLLKDLLKKIPILGTVYSTLDQILRAILATGGDSGTFRTVVYVEYPRRDSWVIAFVTGSSKASKLPDGHINLFVPTVPNPTSGFHLIVPESDVKKTDLSVEEAFRTILSLGIAEPGTENSRPSQKA